LDLLARHDGRMQFEPWLVPPELKGGKGLRPSTIERVCHPNRNRPVTFATGGNCQAVKVVKGKVWDEKGGSYGGRGGWGFFFAIQRSEKGWKVAGTQLCDDHGWEGGETFIKDRLLEGWETEATKDAPKGWGGDTSVLKDLNEKVKGGYHAEIRGNARQSLLTLKTTNKLFGRCRHWGERGFERKTSRKSVKRMEVVLKMK